MTPQEAEYSAMARDAAKYPDRPLGVALAHCMALTPISAQDRHALFAKVYRDSLPAVQVACRAELQAMREAKRGETEARVSWPELPPLVDNVVRIDG